MKQPNEQTKHFNKQLHSCPLLLNLTIHQVEGAGLLAKHLYAAGLKLVELVLRTPQALDALAKMKQSAPELLVGAGTILKPSQIKEAQEKGADFLMAPGVTPTMMEAFKTSSLPTIIGATTASEAMRIYEEGFDIVKFFPAEHSGGVKTLEDISHPLPAIRFIATGGIDAHNAKAYLSLPNVVGVAGAWILDYDAFVKGHWDEVEEKARTAICKITQ